MHAFAGLELGRHAIPDGMIILRFPHLLERRELTKVIFPAVSEQLTAKGKLLRDGTMVEATLIAATPLTKNEAQKPDPGISSSRKGKPVLLRHEGKHWRRRGIAKNGALLFALLALANLHLVRRRLASG